MKPAALSAPIRRLATLLIILGSSLAAVRAETVFYVAPQGNDAWSGKLEAADAAHTDGPFASLQRARDAVREANAASKQPTTVFVRGGIYRLPETLQLDAKDSGSHEAPVVWRAYRDEKPVLSGGRLITNFTPYKDGILKADAAAQGFRGKPFHLLFWEGQRQILARYPNFDPQHPYTGGWTYADGDPVPMYADRHGENKRLLHYKAEDSRRWARPQEGEIFVFPRFNWWNDILPIQSVDPEQRNITTAKDCSYAIRPGDRYYIQGLFEELDAPGEWYLDAKEGTLYFKPPGPLDPQTVTAPALQTLLKLGPDATDITFRGFTFEYCEKTAVVLEQTARCMIAASVIRHAGLIHGSGVEIRGGQNNGVSGCDISDIGGHGIALDGGDRITLTPAGNYADNNYIHHIGVVYKHGVGVSLNGCGNRASHNLIHDGPRMGIMFFGNAHLIEFNHIRHMNLETEDTGGIYTGGRDWLGARGCILRYNYIHDMIGFGRNDKGEWTWPKFAWGIYLDDNTGGVDVIGNIVARCPQASIHLHNGRDNVIENNLFIDGGQEQIAYSGWTTEHRYWGEHLPTMIKGYESVSGQPAWKTMRHMDLHPNQAVLPDGTLMAGNVLQKNIIAYRNPGAKLFQMRAVSYEHNESDRNLIWHDGLPLRTGEEIVKDAGGPNLAPNPGFAVEKPGELPTGWRWQVRPNGSGAALDKTVRQDSAPALRIEGRGTTRDAEGQKLWPNFVSDEIPANPGDAYLLTAKIRAAEPGTKFALMAQSYKRDTFFWSNTKEGTAGPEWQTVEVPIRFPAPGDPACHPEMKSFCIRIDPRQESATLWITDITLRKATALDGWASWQERGNDRHSLVTDPLFIDAAHDDYRLRPESPAFQLGIQQIPVEKIGPYESPLRATWPIMEAPGVRENPM